MQYLGLVPGAGESLGNNRATKARGNNLGPTSTQIGLVLKRGLQKLRAVLRCVRLVEHALKTQISSVKVSRRAGICEQKTKQQQTGKKKQARTPLTSIGRCRVPRSK